MPKIMPAKLAHPYSAVRNTHVAKGQYNQFKSQLTPRLYQVIKGVQKTQCVKNMPTYNFQNIGRCMISAAKTPLHTRGPNDLGCLLPFWLVAS